jgi:hypothetical protein
MPRKGITGHDPWVSLGTRLMHAFTREPCFDPCGMQEQDIVVVWFARATGD